MLQQSLPATSTVQQLPADKSLDTNLHNAADVLGFNISTFSHRVQYAKSLPDMADLFMGLWYEGELSVLYADTNVGKSILAVQIADHIARQGRRVVYVDFELSDKGMEKRAVDPDTGCEYRFHPNMMCVTPKRTSTAVDDCDSMDDDGIYALKKLERLTQMSDSSVLIIDNITCLSGKSGNAETAIAQVKTLLEMRDRCKLSILVIGHLNKYDRTQPVTVDSLVGSKRFIDLVDSAFAIGVSINDVNTKYIIQTKVRNGERIYHSNNVLKTYIARQDGLLRFVLDPECVATEREMITPPRQPSAEKVEKEAHKDELRDSINALLAEGWKKSEAAEILGLKRYEVTRILQS